MNIIPLEKSIIFAGANYEVVIRQAHGFNALKKKKQKVPVNKKKIFIQVHLFRHRYGDL